MKKLFISQPMRGREYDAIMAERKALIADAAVALRTDDLEVLDTYFQHLDKPPLQLLAWSLEKMADADAVILRRAGGMPAAAGWSAWQLPSTACPSLTGRGDLFSKLYYCSV